MEVGAVSDSVNVTADADQVETANASVGQSVDKRKLDDLPNMGRNPFYETVKISQNVTPGGDPKFNRMEDQSGSSAVSIAGGPVTGNNYLLDGIPITDAANRAIIIPTLEAVEQVKIQSNTYDAEMARQDQEAPPLHLDLAALKRMREQLLALASANAELRTRVTELDQEIHRIEQSLSPEMREALGVGE